MLYPTFNQTLLLLVVAAAGLISGLLFDLANFLIVPFKNKTAIKQVLYFFAILLSFGGLFFVNLIFNLGQFRIFVLIEFVFFLLLERFTLGILWTKAVEKCYNKFAEPAKRYLHGRRKKKEEK